MTKTQYSVYRRETGTAGGKAKNDCYDILLECGFLPTYRPADSRFLRIISQWISIKRIKNDCIFAVQYPAISEQMMRLLQKKLPEIRHTFAIVHDIPALQGQGGDLERQVMQLNHFEYLIVHNRKMKAMLQTNGCSSKMICLDAFDYLHDAAHPLAAHPFDGTVCFAGNLDKSRFLLNLDRVKGISFNLYGINNAVDLSAVKNASYRGLLKSDEIQYLLEGDYGLVWDGDSVETCSDIYGEYLKINNPHKMSLYLAAGKPVITWKSSAIAEFITKSRLGIVVDSLEELAEIDLSENYDEMKQNVLKVKQKLADGYYLKTAVSAVLDDIKDNDLMDA